MKPLEFLTSVRAKQRARAAAPPAAQEPAVALVICDDGNGVPLDPAWLAEQEASLAAAARVNDLSIGDGEFATAVWIVQVEAAFREANGASPRARVARILSQGVASGLTAGQLAALRLLVGRVDAARDVLDVAERRRESGRLQVHVGAGARNF